MSSPEKNERRNSIPIIYTSGTYYEVGFDVGRTFRGLIQDHLVSSSSLHEIFLPAYETKAGRAIYDETLGSVKENYPQYIRELQGTADGAQVPFHLLMLLHMDMITSTASKTGHVSGTDLNGCSSLSINMKDQVLLGHTEDSYRNMLNQVYLVSATISEDEPQGKLGTRRESFTAFCYPGHLPGFCLGYNHHGLVFSVNVICLRTLFSARTPRHFLSRALLSATSVEAAHSILRDRGTGVADGFSVNMVFMRQAGDHIFQNVEVGPPRDSDESQLSVVTLSAGQHYFHANRYLHLADAPDETSGSITSSKRREERVSQFPAPKDLHDMLELLSDTKDSSFPIFKEETTVGTSMTLALGVFDLVNKKWTTWMKNPKQADPVMEIPLRFNWDI